MSSPHKADHNIIAELEAENDIDHLSYCQDEDCPVVLHDTEIKMAKTNRINTAKEIASRTGATLVFRVDGTPTLDYRTATKL